MNPKRLLAFLTALLLALCVVVTDGSAQAQSKKVRDSDISLCLSINSFAPTGVVFVLYNDNYVVYKNPRSKTGYLGAQLSKEELAGWAGLIGKLESLPSSYDVSVPLRTCQSYNDIFFTDIRGKKRKISVHGYVDSQSERCKNLPPALLRVCDKMTKFDSSKAETWLPPTLELRLTKSRFENTRPWPEGLPFQNATFRGPSMEFQYIILDCKSYPEQVLSLFDARQSKCDIVKDGQRYGMQFFTLPDGDYRNEEKFHFSG